MDEIVDSLDEGARVENAAIRCAACADCESKRDEVAASVISWDAIRRLETTDELRTFPELTTTDEQHSAETDGILAYYEFGEVRVECSLKGRHRHGKGLVVRTLCDLVLCMGSWCGRKSIVNFEKLDADFKRRTSYQSDVAVLLPWPERFERRLQELLPALRAIVSMRTKIHGLLPELFRAVEQQRKRSGASEVRGLVLVDAPPEAHRLEGFLIEFRVESAANPPIDGASASALMERTRLADRSLDDAVRWVREAGDFFTEANLRRALTTLGADGKLEKVPEGFALSYHGSRTVVVGIR